jgi:starvation-inducible DNA-binding protein
MTRHFNTKNDLPKGARTELISVLNANLANGIDLQLSAKQAHWSVKGPSFMPLHELFDTIFDEATEWVDLIAERVVQLGGVAEGTVASIAAHSKLPEYSLEIFSGPDHVDAMSDALAAFGRSIRSAIDTSEGLGDAGTADLFTEVSRGVDKMLWFVEAHAQSDR